MNFKHKSISSTSSLVCVSQTIYIGTFNLLRFIQCQRGVTRKPFICLGDFRKNYIQLRNNLYIWVVSSSHLSEL